MSNLHFRKANFGGARAPPETSGMSAEDAAKLGRKLVSLVLQIIFGTRYIYLTCILNDLLFTVCAIMNRRVTYQAAGYVCQQSITHSITGSLCMAGAVSHISPFIVFAPPPFLKCPQNDVINTLLTTNPLCLHLRQSIGDVSLFEYDPNDPRASETKRDSIAGFQGMDVSNFN